MNYFTRRLGKRNEVRAPILRSRRRNDPPRSTILADVFELGTGNPSRLSRTNTGEQDQSKRESYAARDWLLYDTGPE